MFAVLIGAGCSKPEDAPPPAPVKSQVNGISMKPAEKKHSAAMKYMAVQEVFTKNCMPCHAAAKPKAGINLTNYAGVIKGGREGAIVTPGHADGSKIIMAMHGKGAKQMPPAGALPADTIKIVEDWINAGAKLE